MKYYNFNNIILSFFGNFTPEDFQKSPIWYEYNDPFELEYLINIEKIPVSWLNENLVYPLNVSNRHPFYSLPKKEFLNHAEFSFVKCEIRFLEYTLYGYFSIIHKTLNTLNIFLDDEVEPLFFFGSELFYEDDKKTIKILSKKLKNNQIESLRQISYTLDKSVKGFFCLNGSFKILKEK